MRHLLILILISITTITTVSAQEFVVGGSFGYSTYNMENMKKMFDNAAEDLEPYGMIIYDNIPNGINYGCYGLSRFGFYAIGINYDFNSSQGIIGDKNGLNYYEYKVDFKGHSIGLVNTFRVIKIEKLGLGIGLQIGYQYTFSRKSEYYPSGQIDYSYPFYSNSYFAEPTINAIYNFPYSEAGVEGGYFFNTKGTYMSKEHKQTLDYHETNWSGWRLRVRVGIHLEQLFGKKA